MHRSAGEDNNYTIYIIYIVYGNDRTYNYCHVSTSDVFKCHVIRR